MKVGDEVGIKWIASSCNVGTRSQCIIDADTRLTDTTFASQQKCEFCRQGYEPLCKQAQCSGYSVDGSFQQYAVSYTSQLSPIPKGLSLADAAPILCAG